MSKAKISSSHARSLIASFTMDTPWDKINANVRHLIELEPTDRAEIFADFLESQSRRFSDQDTQQQLPDKKPRSILKVVKEGVKVRRRKPKKTVDCFTNERRYCDRDDYLNKICLKVQPSQPKNKFSVCRLTNDLDDWGATNFKKIAESILGKSGSIESLAMFLKRRRHVTSLQTIENLIERHEKGERVGFGIRKYISKHKSRGLLNFFFVGSKKKETICLVSVSKEGRKWEIEAYPFPCMGVGLLPGTVLFV